MAAPSIAASFKKDRLEKDRLEKDHFEKGPPRRLIRIGIEPAFFYIHWISGKPAHFALWKR